MQDTTNAPAIVITDKKRSILADRQFLLVWLGQSVSLLGDSCFNVILILWIVTVIAPNQPWAPLAISSIVLAVTLPVIIVGPWAGVFADRWNKRLTVIRMDILRAAFLLVLAAGAWSLTIINVNQIPRLPLLVCVDIVVFLVSICAQFFNPSLNGVFMAVIDEPDRPRGLGFMQSSSNLVVLIGPPLATLLFFHTGVFWLLLFDSLTYIVSFVTLFLLRIPQEQPSEQPVQPPNFAREFREGLSFYAGSYILKVLLIGIVLAGAVESSINTLDVFFLTKNLHTSVSLYGLLATATGLGLTLGGFLVGQFAQRIGLLRVFWISLLVGGIFVFIFSRVTSFIPALVLQALLGFAIGALNVAVGPIILNIVPSNLIGRVLSIQTPALLLSATLSTVLASYLSTVLKFHINVIGVTLGPIDTIFSIGGIIFALGGIYAMIKLRKVNLSVSS